MCTRSPTRAACRSSFEFADLVRQAGEGYIDYVWQWKDDPQRLEPKESYVKGFEPWGWVIGTGIYTDDVNAEIARIEQGLINTSLVISGGRGAAACSSSCSRACASSASGRRS